MPKANKLIHESSPYLLQHAYNPVNWQAWGEEALNEASVKDKPILLSIGYAACHWCHVMEHESFEDEKVAQLMNENYVCIKLDREERPDIDHIYMDAIQAMGIQGGWPLNIFLTPDQKPFYGGTYFPKINWLEILDRVAMAFQKNRSKLEESADQFAKALNQSELTNLPLASGQEAVFDKKYLNRAAENLLKYIDWDNGGILGAPKFPMPVIWKFLIRYAHFSSNKTAQEAVNFSLTSLANGGIYDQVGGGFARYSVDAEWFAPHFEKMLYDNGQLLSNFSEAMQLTGNEYFKEIINDTVYFIQRELTNELNGFYSALDADSEGEEGKYYTWTYDEFLKAIEGEHKNHLAKFLNVREEGNWENGTNILFRHTSVEAFSKAEGLNPRDFKKSIEEGLKNLLHKRKERIRPSLDDKTLCGWNGLMIKGLTDAYKAIGEDSFKKMAIDGLNFIHQYLWNGEILFRSFKDGKAKIAAYLEDYAAIINASLAVFEITSDKSYLNFASELANYCIANFYDSEESFFYFTDANGEELIARKKEIFDNVIPSSNSSMIENLHWLGILSGNQTFSNISNQMLAKMQQLVKKEPKYLSNYGSALVLKIYNCYDIVIVGENASKYQQQIWSKFTPNCFILALENEKSDAIIFKGKVVIDNQTTVYVCQNHACQKPVFNVEEALSHIKS